MSSGEYSEIIRKVLSDDERVSYAYLFGSALTHLRGDSDIDILVGGDLDFDTRMDLTAKLSLALKRKVDLVPARSARSEVVLKAMSKGVPVFVRDKGAFKQDYFRAFRAYDDAINLRRSKAEHLKRLYSNG
jgi:predicted nucleotidyltransferase